MDERILYDGFHKIIELTRDIKGKPAKREQIKFPNAAGGLIMDEDLRILLVKQYRPTVDQFTYEIPAGILDKDLSPLDTLFEELHEECEIDKEKDVLYYDEIPFHKYYMVTGSSDAYIELFHMSIKNQNFRTKTIEDDNDVEEIEWVTLKELETYIMQRKVVDAKTIVAYYHAQSIGKGPLKNIVHPITNSEEVIYVTTEMENDLAILVKLLEFQNQLSKQLNGEMIVKEIRTGTAINMSNRKEKAESEKQHPLITQKYEFNTEYALEEIKHLDNLSQILAGRIKRLEKDIDEYRNKLPNKTINDLIDACISKEISPHDESIEWNIGQSRKLSGGSIYEK